MPTATASPVAAQLKITPKADRSCLTCPNAMTSAEVTERVGKGINSPACAVKQLPLILPLQGNRVRERTTAHIAASCDKFGTPRPDFAQGVREAPIHWGPVAIPMPAVNAWPPAEGANRAVRNCNSCANYVSPTMVSEETGWSAGYCAARGTLLMPDRLRAYATDCPDRLAVSYEPSAKKVDPSKIMWLPEYSPLFGEVDMAAVMRRMREVDPLDWPTDRPVTHKQTARGIKAWRRIDDPDGEGKSVYLPIYNPNHFSPELQSIIPRSGDAEHPELYHDHGGFTYQLAVLWMELDLTPAVWGPPGVGKTELARHMAWLMGLPFIRISITGSTEIDDIAGKMMYDPEKGTYFQFGRLPKAWSQPGVILVDEPNVGPPDVWQFIRPLTDNSRQLVIDQANGDKVARHPDCFFTLAMNPAWDMRNVGANTIGDADARRLLHLYMDLPPEHIERQIITAWCQKTDNFDPAPHLDNIMKIAKDIRGMADNGSIPVTWGLANQIKVARLMNWFGPTKAYQIAVLNYLAPNVGAEVMDAIKSYIPS